MGKLLDLRFVIGSFFSIVGALLVMFYFTSSSAVKLISSINISCGILFILFGSGMIVLSYLQKLKD